MSCFVKYMECPEKCKYCDFKDCCDEDGEVYCPVLGDLRSILGKNEDCPVKELPETHGRLIDENDVYKVIERFLGYLDEEMIYRIKFKVHQHCPTIIEAEGIE